MTLTIPRPQTLFDRAVRQLDLSGSSTRCLPRPGPIPAKARVSLASNRKGLHASVTTFPANPEVNACLERHLQDALRDFGPGAWDLRATAERALAPTMSAESLRTLASQYAPSHATDCYPAKNPPARVEVTVVAERDAEHFRIAIEGGDEAFRTCLRDKLEGGLRGSYSVPRQLPDGSYERYFRIDAGARATFGFALETPAARERRIGQDIDREFEL